MEWRPPRSALMSLTKITGIRSPTTIIATLQLLRWLPPAPWALLPRPISRNYGQRTTLPPWIARMPRRYRWPYEDIAANATTPYSITVSGNDPVTTEAASMLSSLSSLTAEADLVGLVGPNGPSGEQSYVVAVPEPTTVGCFLFGLSALACSRRFAKNESKR